MEASLLERFHGSTSLRVGDIVIENVTGGVAPMQGSLLLGQSFLERFKSWSVDNTTHVLLLEAK